jgi:hypothetical protein
MLRRAAFLSCLVLLFSVSAHAQSDKFQLFGGYSYQWANVSNGPSFGQNGWEGSLQYKFSSLLGVVADFDGHYGQTQGVNSTVYTYLFGPQISFGPALGFPSRFEPFAQILVGGAHAHFTGNTSDNAVAWTFGVGLDYKVMPWLYWRVLQGNYEPTYFFSHTQNNARLSTGLVIHF